MYFLGQAPCSRRDTRQSVDIPRSYFWSGSCMQFAHASASLHPPSHHKGDGQRHSLCDRRQQIGLLQLRFIWHHGSYHRPFTARAELGGSCSLPCSVSIISHSASSITALAVEARFIFKIAVLTHKVRHHHQPTYLSSMITDYKPTRSLRSAVADLLVIPRTKTVTASRAFRTAAPKPPMFGTASHPRSDHQTPSPDSVVN